MALQISAETVSRHFGDDVVLVHLQTNRIYSLNQTGARVWSLLTDGHDRESIVALLAGEFDVSSGTLTHEVEALLTSLREERLVEDIHGS